MTFNKVNPKQSFPELEKEIINYWKENDTFKKSIITRENSEEFDFYDGPPFATGTPHYGHILAGTIKDVVPRYQTMLGKKVDRKFGWDCHGLPIENIVEKKLQISGKDDIENKIWVYDFNEACRANVFGYVDEWKKSVERMWRWVDMENDYKTMDTKFMESVWWVFKSIYDKWLIYEGNKIVPYCPRCTTPLSNFEVNQGYKDKQSKTITVKFKVAGTENKYILAWTTTPWTLYANLGLAVWTEIMYSEILDTKTWETYILASEKIKDYYKVNSAGRENPLGDKNPEDYTVMREYKGSCLVWIKYKPLFPDFDVQLREMWKDLGTTIKLGKNAFSVVAWHHVTTETWVWIVHIAPAYGEDDFVIWEKEDLWFVAHIDNSGKSYNLLDKNGINVFELNDMVISELKEQKLSVNIGTIMHSYPHCWRCDTPLIYRWISAWYVAVEQIRDKMVANNKEISWVPEVIKEWRFGKWLEWARDWNISRNRYWGSAIPVWQSEDKKEEICIWSIEELYELNKDFGQIEKKWNWYFYTSSGKEVDLHKHFVDEILVKNPKTWNTLKRVSEVLDCWFESGSMPYASKHYPFENKENFKFPADFIAEWLDQTRGWFYTLIILSTALFDKPAFLNCVVNGIILAEDGKKMSKSLKNYTDPNILMDKYWADAMRFYLMNSPVVEAQDLRFSDAWVEEVVKKVILPFWNTYSFFTTYANIDNFKPKNGNIYYVRHGQTENNAKWMMNAWESDSPLNDVWVKQAKRAWQDFKISGVKFDKIYVSPKLRTRQTAELIAKELGYEVEIIADDRFTEQYAGKFDWLSHDDIKKMYNVTSTAEMRRLYKEENWVENVEAFEKRVLEAYNEILKSNEWKNVLIVAHAWTFRPINRQLNNLTKYEAHFAWDSCDNWVIYKLPNYTKNNPLDKWIISELHSLTWEVRNSLDNYKLNEAAKPIVKFMDNLTNWYIRRSRKRFWKSDTDSDKLEAYNTLYDVLIEVSKVIAPYMPFVSEYVFKNLTGKESVHLELYPTRNKAFIFEELNANTSEVQNIITLWLAARANAKLRVRQPLQYVKITHKLDEYFEEILREELNVKEIRVFDKNEIPSQICKPNARLIGPKFGGDVKFIISEAKAGNFTLLQNGWVKVWEFELNPWEFEIEFVSSETSMNSNEVLESWNGMVVALDITITQNLKLEWYTRDIVRQIQESRKEADFNVDDRIQVSISWDMVSEILSKFKSYIETETLSTIVSDLQNPNLEKEVEVEDLKVKLRLKK